MNSGLDLLIITQIRRLSSVGVTNSYTESALFAVVPSVATRAAHHRNVCEVTRPPCRNAATQGGAAYTTTEDQLYGTDFHTTSHPKFYGCVYPEEQAPKETRVICRLHASKITLDAIHR